MKKRIILQGLFIMLLGLYMTNSYGQIGPNLNLHGTANAVWDSARNRYLYTFQDESSYSRIYQCDSNGLNPSVYTDQGGNMMFPSGMLIKDSFLYVADMTKIWKLNLSDGSYYDAITNSPFWQGLIDIATDGVNTLYVSECFNSKVYKVNMTTNKISVLPDPSGKLVNPTGLYYEAKPNPKLYIVSFKPNSPVQSFDFTGDSINLVYPTSYQFCYSITGDGKGNYYLTDWTSTAPNAGTVYKFIGGFSVSKPFVEHLNFPADVFYRADRDLVVIPELKSGKNTLLIAKSDKDLICPLVDTAYATSATTVLVFFNEPVGSITGTYKLNYGGLGSDITIALNPAHTQATITLGTPLILNKLTELNISNVKDLAGNSLWQGRKINIIYKGSSIYDAYLKEGVSVYPNPVQDRFNLSYNLLQTANVNIELYDIMGKQVANFYNGIQNPDTYNFGCQLPGNITGNGIYILKVTVEGQIFMSRIMVNR